MRVFGGLTKSKPASDFVGLADAARDRMNWHEAAAGYRRAVDADPSLKHIWVQLGNCEKERGRLEAAESAYRTSLQIDPQVADTHVQLGHVLKLQGKLANAKASYETALELDPNSSAAAAEVVALSELSISSMKACAKSCGQARLAFECSDLVEYFKDNRLPTGIQRVQINIIQSGLTIDEFSRRIRIIFYSKDDSDWHEITALDFLAVVNASQQIHFVSDTAWHAIRARICGAKTAPHFEFAQGDTLINIGTSWWIDDYFLRVRNLKSQYDLKYVPFVHDCIPLVTPEHCAENLTKEFAIWIEGVFRHADHFLVNSRATEADLMKFAAQFKHERPAVHVVRLDGDLNARSFKTEDGPDDRQRLRSIFEKNEMVSNGTESPKFVLLVSTLESRKNHTLAFIVWDQLISTLGLEKTPYLVCVGKQGWMFENALAFLRSRPRLQRRVRFLSGVDDRSLSSLYDGCEFTFYPSHYEGWGLPVTESLCHGKVPVVANKSSLPEAGGAFSLYFDPLSPLEAYGVAEKLIVDERFRSGLEARITAEFLPRAWSEIAGDLLSASSGTRAKAETDNEAEPEPPAWVERVDPAVIYELAKPRRGPDGDRVRSGIHLRVGEGWFGCEYWGVWTGHGDARLRFIFPDENCRELLVYMRLMGAPERGSSLHVAANFSDAVLAVSMAADEIKWFNFAFPVSQRVRVKELSLRTPEFVDLSGLTNGSDQRRIGCGVCAFGAASRSDFEGRLAMMEAAAFVAGRAV